jgi:hypothetical protein
MTVHQVICNTSFYKYHRDSIILRDNLSVIPPGMAKNGKRHKPRLYSITLTRYGDLLDGSTVSLGVCLVEYVDSTTNWIDPSKVGVCSTVLCNLQKGNIVNIASRVGKTMLLQEDPTKDIIMGNRNGHRTVPGFLTLIVPRKYNSTTCVSGYRVINTGWLISVAQFKPVCAWERATTSHYVDVWSKSNSQTKF